MLLCTVLHLQTMCTCPCTAQLIRVYERVARGKQPISNLLLGSHVDRRAAAVAKVE